MVRTSTDPTSFMKNLRFEVQSVDPTVRIVKLGTLDSALRDFYRGPQFELVVLTTFAGIGLALVLIGIFSVMAYTVSLQTHEIGVRMALGAQRGNILRFALLKGFRLIAAGVLGGIVASLLTTRFLASQISGVSPTDPGTFVVVIIFVVLAGLAACALPARHAANVDPLVALRYE